MLPKFIHNSGEIFLMFTCEHCGKNAYRYLERHIELPCAPFHWLCWSWGVYVVGRVRRSVDPSCSTWPEFLVTFEIAYGRYHHTDLYYHRTRKSLLLGWSPLCFGGRFDKLPKETIPVNPAAQLPLGKPLRWGCNVWVPWLNASKIRIQVAKWCNYGTRCNNAARSDPSQWS